MTLLSASIVGGLTSGIVSSVLSAIAHAITSGIVSLASWAIGGLAHAATATTAVNLETWFQGPWRAMLAVASLAALPLFFAGVLESLVHGEGVSGLARVLGRLALAGVGALVGLALVQLLLGLTDASCEIVEHTSGISISAALARLGTALGVTTIVGGGAVAAVGALLLALCAALAALVLWLELAMRTVLILVTTAFLPLGLSGLLWPKTASWLRRLGEILTAIVISKLVIVVVLVLGAAALTNSSISITAPGADIDAMVQGVAFLGLATLGLPIALRVVPFAAEAALSPGRGGVLVRSGYAASRMAGGVNSTGSLIRHVRGDSQGTGTDGGEPTPGGGPNMPGGGPSSAGPTGGRPPGGSPAPSGSTPGGTGTSAESASASATRSGAHGGSTSSATRGVDGTALGSDDAVRTTTGKPSPAQPSTERTSSPRKPNARPAPSIRPRPAGGTR